MRLPCALVVGVGPGLGAAIARRFAESGHPVALAARRGDFIEKLSGEIREKGGRALAVPYDASKEDQVRSAIREVRASLGTVGILLYNVGNMRWGSLDEISVQDFRGALEVGPLGAFLHCRELFPDMAEMGGGTAIFTGATSSRRAPAHSPAFGAAKFGLRGLALSLARGWSKRGIHVAHVLIDGRISREERGHEPAIRPESIAEAYYQLSIQPRDAWTFELDLRPHADDLMDN